MSVILSIFINENCGQRLSQGASDWYMRFHSNFRRVERDVDPPEIKSFRVMSLLHKRISGVVGELTSQNVNTAAMRKSLIIIIQNELKRIVIKTRY